ncbi:asparagine synthase (glutamine-hydrolyzing) [Croceifilum oryzae]|nr:asparagine synthase (glutamine-hydrolyzing) [Croceifilum oryzae]
MCGITGWIDWERDLTKEEQVVQKMVDTMIDRGPDAGGMWLSPRAALGHRRLSVIDIDGGAQPMKRTFADQNVVLTYSGEIYNFVELRNELMQRGYHFTTRSDTEVLLFSYIEWGKSCVDRLNGIFAFAIWDEEREELFLVRDRLGVKPLYYAVRGSAILFGSEPKALLANPLVQPEVDEKGLAEIFLMTCRTPGQGFYKDVHELRAGHTISFQRSGTKTTQYWKLQSAPHLHDIEETAQHIRELMFDIVGRQLVSDVPICTLLSGGVDSSAVTSIASQILKEKGENVHTYSIDFKDSSDHFQKSEIHTGLDTPFVKMMADYLKSDHRDVVLDTPDLISNFLTPLYARDFPALGDIDTSIFLLFKAIKQKASVALSGESSDELFGGYPWFHSPEPTEVQALPWLYRTDFAGLLSPELHDRLKPKEYILDHYHTAISEVPYLPGENDRDRRLRELFYLNLTYFLPVLLDRKDRMSMAVGLEVRVPFCDHRLMEYAWNIPWEMKNTGGMEKGILRKALKGLLPEEVLYRKKSAYPISYNPSYVAEMRTRMEGILQDSNSPILPFIDREKLDSMVRGTNNDIHLIHGPVRAFEYFIQVNTWLKEYKVRVAV